MKTTILLLIFAVFALSTYTAKAQVTKQETIKQIKVESSESKTILTMYGILDSTTFRVMGLTKGGWNVNVKCFKRTATKEKWFTPDHYKYCYKGMDTQYRWTIMFYNDGTIRVHQNKKGVKDPSDIYGGEYPLEQSWETDENKEPKNNENNEDSIDNSLLNKATEKPIQSIASTKP